MRCERQQHLGAALYEHGADRSDQANGFYQRKLVTRLGGMRLAVPQSRSGGRLSTTIACNISFFPKTPLGRADKLEMYRKKLEVTSRQK
jgi:hypothetical protein